MRIAGWIKTQTKTGVNAATVNAYAATTPGDPVTASLGTTSTDGNGYFALTGLAAEAIDVNVDSAGTGFWLKGMSEWVINRLGLGTALHFADQAADLAVPGVSNETLLFTRQGTGVAPLLRARNGTAGIVCTVPVRGYKNVSAIYTMIPGDEWVVQSAAAAVTLPAANSLPAGSKVTIKSLINGASVIRAGTDTMFSNASGVTSVTLNIGDSQDLRTDGTATWYLV